jgi:hypothetical protein
MMTEKVISVAGGFLRIQLTRFVDQHGGDAVHNREGQLVSFANQFLLFAVVAQWAFAQRADQHFE